MKKYYIYFFVISICFLGGFEFVNAATNVYYSVGQNTNDHKITSGTLTVTIVGGVATFSEAQTATNLGVGDKVTYNTTTIAYIASKTSTTVWNLVTAIGAPVPDAAGQTVDSITHAYSSLSSAESSIPTPLGTSDLVTGDYILNIPLYNDAGAADTTAVTIAGWTTGTNNYIKIYTPTSTTTEANQSQRHSGVWDNNKYWLETSGGAASPLKISSSTDTNHVRVEGLQVSSGLNASGNSVVDSTNARDIRISNNIFRQGSTTNTFGLTIYGNSSTVARVFNNIFYDFSGGNYGLQLRSTQPTSYVYNNTFYNCAAGIGNFAGTNTRAKNNLIQGLLSGQSFFTNLNASSSNNICNISGGSCSSVATSTFIDTISKNFHLPSSDTVAKDTGADLSTDFSTDIDGETRSGVWDVGADEYNDIIPPTLSPVNIVSNNASTSLAKTGDVVTLAFTSSESVSTPTVTITGASSSVSGGPTAWSATHTMLITDTEGTVAFTINFADTAGNAGTQVTTTTDASAVTFDRTAPTLVGVPTFGTITTNSIEIIKPSSVTENGSGLYQWQARRDSTTELGFIATSTISITDSSLSENTQYTYGGQFKDNAGNVSDYGTTGSQYTLADAPTNLSASAGSNNITLTIDSLPNATSGLSGYYFSRSGANSGWIQTNIWQDTGLACENSYDYSVKYRNGNGVETDSISITKSTTGCGGGGMPASWNNKPIVPPSGFKMIINSGINKTPSRIIDLNFNAGDDSKRMAISMTGDFTDASQENYQPNKQVDICSKFSGAIKNITCHDGVYTIYVKFYTQQGVSSDVILGKVELVTSRQFPVAITRPINESPKAPEAVFLRNLRYGMRSDDISKLQEALSTNLEIYPEGLITGYFGSLTKKAVQRFQLKYKIVNSKSDPGFSLVGLKTRKKLNELYGR